MFVLIRQAVRLKPKLTRNLLECVLNAARHVHTERATMP
jgi:hypothetical protein